MNMEEWKDIEGLEGRYQVSSYGRIKRLRHKVVYKNDKIKLLEERFEKLSSNKEGYRIANLPNGKFNSVYRLVAKHFIANPENKLIVNHIDGDPSNDNVCNLEWVTQSENMKKAHRKYNLGKKRPVYCYETQQFYPSISNAQKSIGLCVQSVERSIFSRTPVKGYSFDFVVDGKVVPFTGNKLLEL